MLQNPAYRLPALYFMKRFIVASYNKLYLALSVLCITLLTKKLDAIEKAGESTVIISDKLMINTVDKTAYFTGNVVVTKQKTRLKADNMKIKYNSNNSSENTKSSKIDKILANGNIEIKADSDLAYGDKAEYDIKKSIIVLYDNVKLIQNKNTMLANKITIEVSTGKVYVDSDKKSIQDSGRVRAIINSNMSKK